MMGTDLEAAVASAPAIKITASTLRDLYICERKVGHDMHSDAELRGPVSSFVEMLWAHGNRQEASILAELPGAITDLREIPMADRLEATCAAMTGDADWIIGARLSHADLDGLPDLLHRDPSSTWCAGDVKSGSPFAANGISYRAEYALQVGLYAYMLGQLGGGASDRAFVIGADRTVSWYDLRSEGGPNKASWQHAVQVAIDLARRIRDGEHRATGALSSQCGMCVWRAPCRGELQRTDDLTLVPALGRAVREKMKPHVPTVTALASLSIEQAVTGSGRTIVPGVGPARLATFRERARMLVNPDALPFAIRPLGLERAAEEHHLDLETDPTAGDFCYLHGVLRRIRTADGDVEEYISFLAEDPGQEKQAFAAAIAFLTADPNVLLTTYSKFERTTYRQLQRRYPDVVSVEKVETLFDPGRCVDLYFDVILPFTHWPLNSLGLKPIAKYLGFDWNDSEASGAASIAWFVEWSETRDAKLLDRILTYNRNDCVASRVVFDGAMALPVLDAAPWSSSHR